MSKFYMQDWLGVNRRQKKVPTDDWYLDFANRLSAVIHQSSLKENDNYNAIAKELILQCTLYLQDAVAQSGGWKAFSDLYYTRYHTYLPFYTITNQYIPDEVNPEDIAFILWMLLANATRKNIEEEGMFVDPFSSSIQEASRQICEWIDSAFEEAPINEVPSPKEWVTCYDSLLTSATPLPEITDNYPDKNVENCLRYSKGYPLLYFATHDELKHFFINTLGWDDHEDSLFTEYKDSTGFVIYANAKGMLLAPDVAFCFRDPHNPLYQQEEAKQEGYKLFCIPGCCPYDLLKYGMNSKLFPDVQLPITNGKEIFHNNWDFITRFYLLEYYEGD